MNENRSVTQEAAEDIFFGQAVINWARWFLIGVGIILIMWTSDNEREIAMGVIPVVALMILNFYLHGRHLAEKPASPVLVGLASLLDLAVVTTVVLFWAEATGLSSQFFILYYPVVLAFAFVMPPRVSIVFTVATMGAYAGASFLVDPDLVGSVFATKALLVRLITIGAVGGLGAYYWRIQRDRRRTVAAQGSLSFRLDP